MVIAKKTTRKRVAKKKVEKPVEKKERYFESVGRRKTATARVRIFPGNEKGITVNEKPLEQYFPTLEMRQKVISPLEKMGLIDKFKVLVRVKGGGLNAQSEAVRYAIARALSVFNPEFRPILKSAGFISRDSRMRERKKFGLKRARRAPQWSKR